MLTALTFLAIGAIVLVSLMVIATSLKSAFAHAANLRLQLSDLASENEASLLPPTRRAPVVRRSPAAMPNRRKVSPRAAAA